MPTLALVDKLRRRIKDDRPNQRALSLSVSDDTVTRAIGEISDNHLSVSVQGGQVAGISLNLSDPRFSTIGRLHKHLSRISGYTVGFDEDAMVDHPSIDLQDVAPMDIGPGRSSMELRHFTFSDSELEEVLRDAITRHNPGFSQATLPDGEEVFVLQLAHAEVCRRQAYDSSKRRGLSETVADLLAIAQSLETVYWDDVNRLARSIASPKEATPNTMGEGDVVIGTLFRQSLRTGFQSPLGQNLPPTIPVLIYPEDVRDIEDTNIRFRWERNRDNDMYSMELWLDTQQDVERSTLLGVQGVPFSGTPIVNSQENVGVIRPTTSKLVFRSFGPNSNFDTAAFHTFFEQFGQAIAAYTVGELEPDTEYFARLYVIDRNYEVSASEVVRYKTKPLRAKFASGSYASSLVGSPTTVITLSFDSSFGAVTAAHRLTIGGTNAPLTILGPYSATFVVPSFVNKRLLKDLVIISPSGLRDIKEAVFQVT